jgi:class 3 adenylate cyclase/TPR repeat protein
MLVLSAFLCTMPEGKTQEVVSDSLFRVLKDMPEDSNRVNVLLKISGEFYRSDPDIARSYAIQAKELAEKIEFDRGLGYAHKAIGMSYYFQNNWIDALVEWELALDVFRSIGHREGESNMLNNLGAVHFNGGDNEAALKFYLQSLKAAEETGDTLRTVTALINIGTVYLDKEAQHHLAFNYYKRALPICKALGDYDALGTCAVHLGDIYINDSTKLDSALYYYELALDSYQSSATGNVAFAMKNIGRVYAEKGEFDQAIKFQTDAFNLAKSLDARLEMAQSLQSLAMTYELKGDHPKAVETFGEVRDLSSEIDAPYELLSSYEGLANNYSKLSQYDSAFTYKSRYAGLRDSLYNAEMDKQLQAQTLGYEIEKKQGQISLLEKDKEINEVELKRQKQIRNAAGIVGVLLLVMIGGLFNRYKYTRKTNRIIAEEKDRSDNLLLNILPSETAEELKLKGSATPKSYEKVSVLFTDFKGFTKIAEKLSPEELVEELNLSFKAFDEIISKHGLEKIKTIGDAYMCAGGIPVPNDSNPVDIIKAALEIRDFMDSWKKDKIAKGEPVWELRIGIHTGPVVAGVVGMKKFAYDIWGDAVNTAARMESSGIPGEINISGTTYALIKDHFECKYRGKIEAKNKGEIDMYLVKKPKVAVLEMERLEEA